MTVSLVGATREYYFNSADSETSRTGAGSDSYADKVSLTFTGDGSDYLIVASWVASNSSASNVAYWRLYDDTAEATASEIAWTANAYGYYLGMAAMDVKTVTGSQTYSIEYRHSSTGNTVYARSARIFALKLTAADEYVEEVGASTTTATTWQDKATLTFTPGSQGDYIILASAVLGIADSSDHAQAQLDINATTQFGDIYRFNAGAATEGSWAIVTKTTLAAESNTLKVQYRHAKAAAGNLTISDVRLVALRADEFEDIIYGEQKTRATTTSTSEQTFLTVTDTPVAVDHVVFAGMLPGTQTQNGLKVLAYLYEGDAAQFNTDWLSRNLYYNEAHSNFFVGVKEYAGEEVSWTVRYKSSTNGQTVSMDDSSVAVLQLETTGPPPEPAPFNPAIINSPVRY